MGRSAFAVLGFLLTIAAAGPAAAATLLVANKTDSTVSLIALPSGEVRATLPTGEGPHEVAVSPDGRLAAVSDYGRSAPGSTVTVLDVEAATVVRSVQLGEHRRPHGLAWLPDGRLLVTTEASRSLLVVDPKDGKVLAATPTGQEVSHMVVATPDGRRAFVANIGSGSVTVVDLVERRKVRDVPTGAGAEAIAVSPDGKQVWVGNRAADTLTVMDAATLEVLAQIPCPGFPIRMALTPDGKRVLVSCARSGEVAVFDGSSRKELFRRKLDLASVKDAGSRLFGDRFGESPVPVGLLVAPDGGRAWVAATQADAVVALDPGTLEVIGLLRAGREPDGMAYSKVDVKAAGAGH